MPFTPSHAIVALPWVKSRVPTAAIAVGAMTPDLPLFTLHWPVSYGVTHDVRWLPVTLVLAAVLLCVWWGVIRPAVRGLVPRWVAVRLPREWDASARASLRSNWRGPRRVVAVLLAALAGILSHIVWDSFTHVGRAATHIFPALAEPWGLLPGYKWLQHSSSVLGLVVLIIFVAGWLRRRPQQPTVWTPSTLRIMVLPAVLAILLVSAFSLGIAIYGPLRTDFGVEHVAYRMLPPACALWGCVVVVVCVWLSSRRHPIPGRHSRR
ncbi:DUF4184 family protein [Microbacterium sp. YY-01]|uniref:DUF4184 family protein n=1 Tax=Microbacterium sp. YY-01 TaxID=3421634 RepID=UPI003D17A349